MSSDLAGRTAEGAQPSQHGGRQRRAPTPLHPGQRTPHGQHQVVGPGALQHQIPVDLLPVAGNHLGQVVQPEQPRPLAQAVLQEVPAEVKHLGLGAQHTASGISHAKRLRRLPEPV